VDGSEQPGHLSVAQLRHLRPRIDPRREQDFTLGDVPDSSYHRLIQQGLTNGKSLTHQPFGDFFFRERLIHRIWARSRKLFIHSFLRLDLEHLPAKVADGVRPDVESDPCVGRQEELLAVEFFPGAPHEKVVVQEEIFLEFQENVLAFAEDPLDSFAVERLGGDVFTGRLATKHLAGRKVLL
jgi:hypothetical protein